MGVVIAEVEPPPSGGVAPAASLLQGFASRLDVEAGEVLDELRMSVRHAARTDQTANPMTSVDVACVCLRVAWVLLDEHSLRLVPTVRDREIAVIMSSIR